MGVSENEKAHTRPFASCMGSFLELIDIGQMVYSHMVYGSGFRVIVIDFSVSWAQEVADVVYDAGLKVREQGFGV
jgi:hypothetical protein